MYRILGVDKIFLHDTSLIFADEEIKKVFQYYIQSDFVEYRKFPTPFQYVLNKEQFSGKTEFAASTLTDPAALNTCFFENQHMYKYYLHVDLDEILIPIQHRTYMDMFSSLQQDANFYNLFANTTVSIEASWAMLYNRTREDLFKLFSYEDYFLYSRKGKSFTKTELCGFMGIHRCRYPEETLLPQECSSNNAL
jgi:hypothetical protein